METIFLQNHEDRLNLQDGQLVQSRHQVVIGEYPLRATRQISVHGNSQITTQAVKACLAEGIRIEYFDVYGRFLGSLEPDRPRNHSRRLAQYRLYFDPRRRLNWAKTLLLLKIQTELVELRRLHEQNIDFPLQTFRREMNARYRQIDTAADLPELLGIEGCCAKTYYGAFSYVLPVELPWNGRHGHPAPDGINALLSLIYSVTAREIRTELPRHGLDPHCGFLHEPGNSGLTSDLLEPMRATFCDHLALRIARKDPEICRRATPLPSGGVILGRTGCGRVCSLVRAALDIRHARQRFTPREQFRNILSAAADALDRNADAPDFRAILPER